MAGQTFMCHTSSFFCLFDLADFFFLNMGRPDTTPKGFVSPGTEQGIFHLLAKCITTRLWTIYYCQQI